MGGAGLLSAMQSAFPEARVIRRLQHVKGNIMKARQEWTSTSQGKNVKNWVHKSAFLHPPLFSLFWHGALAELRALGEADFADWLLGANRGGHLVMDEETGTIAAAWQCSLSDTEPPFSSYSQNSIEVLWRVMDDAADDMPLRIDLLTEIRFLRELTELWHKRGKYKDIVPHLLIGRPSVKASTLYLRGKGKLTQGAVKRKSEPSADAGDAATDAHKRLRRLTVNSILNLAQAGEFALEEELVRTRMAHKRKPPATYACPKYDGAQFNKEFLKDYTKVVTQPLLDTPAARRLGFVTETGDIDIDRILEVTQQYTVLFVNDDRIQEIHQDFIVHGETEHARWLEHKLKYKNHSPVPQAGPTRQTGRGLKPQVGAQGKSRAAKPQQKPAATQQYEGFCGGLPGARPALDLADDDDSITITLHGQGTNNQFASFTARAGVTARQLAQRVSALIGQPEDEFRLANLDNPMYLVGNMKLFRSTRVAVQIAVRGG